MRVTFFLLLCISSCQPAVQYVYESDELMIEQVGDHSYRHISYLKTEDFGNVPCNGMISVIGGEAFIADAPTTTQATRELINWVQEDLQADIIAVVATHFHEDCTGGLEEFHRKGIPSYGSDQTIELAQLRNLPVPANAFSGSLEITIDDEILMAAFPGEGHTTDNVIVYFPKDLIVFGGCLIKAEGAGKGNLADANVDQWSQTVRNVKSSFRNAKTIIPGHGKPGGQELLDYTIDLFDKEE